MKLSSANIKIITGVEISTEEANVFIPIVINEIKNYCNQNFLEDSLSTDPDYPADLCYVAAKRVVEIYKNRTQINEKEVKRETIGSMTVEYFQDDNNNINSNGYYDVLNRYRIPSL